ncbi:MAG: Rab geranylgeranyltransferase [Vezdaea aestivalis]|nr:MAG: Rab geranylgeranyltransferase [Vezdaea aestivalis]
MASHGVPRPTAPQLKSEQAKKKELDQIEKYQSLVGLVNENISAKVFTLETLSLTSKLLTQNPEYYSIWNHRRRILLKGLFAPLTASNIPSDGPGDTPPILPLIQSDLQFLLPLLRQYPKCYWIWNHRLWLLRQATIRLSPDVALDLWTRELALVTKLLSLDGRNFHGWGYRRGVVAAIDELQVPEAQDQSDALDTSRSTSGTLAPSKLRTSTSLELAYATQAINTNLSNFSAWHARLVLLPRYLTEQQATKDTRDKAWREELDLIHRALWTDPDDRAIWAFYDALTGMVELEGEEEAKRSIWGVEGVEEDERKRILKGEVAFVRDLIDEGGEEGKGVLEGLLRLEGKLENVRDKDAEARTELRLVWEKLMTADPLRKGRWQDWGREMGFIE